MTKEKKLWILNSATSLGLITWGRIYWDYGLKPMHSSSEGWFGRDTKEGGADKLGHLYSSYLAGHAYASIYKGWGYGREKAALYGAYSSFGFTTLMELGDSFSPYGFSYEDFLVNTAGTLWGYYSYRYPRLQEMIDLRLEYRFHKRSFSGDFFTDYERMKHLVALKASGFELLNRGWISYLELHLGYFTQGFNDPVKSRERFTYIGIGINLAKLFHTRVFNYYQIPSTDSRITHGF